MTLTHILPLFRTYIQKHTITKPSKTGQNTKNTCFYSVFFVHKKCTFMHTRWWVPGTKIALKTPFLGPLFRVQKVWFYAVFSYIGGFYGILVIGPSYNRNSLIYYNKFLSFLSIFHQNVNYNHNSRQGRKHENQGFLKIPRWNLKTQCKLVHF